MAKDTSLTFSLYGKDVSATKAMKEVGNQSDTLGKKLSSMGKVAATALAGAAIAAAKFAYDAGQAASDLAESQSKAKVIFGQNAIAIEKFAKSAAKNLGQSKQEAIDAAASFAIFGKSAGLRGKELVKFSTGLTSVSSDMASFANTTPQEAIEAVGAALRGEAEPIRRYGVLLDDATLKNEAMALGIIKTTKDSLTPQQKILAAQSAIYKQLGKDGSNTIGDFARTSDGLANKQRILAASFKNTKTDLGKALLPMMQKFADYILENVVPNVQGFVDGLTGVKNKGGEAAKSAHNFGEKVKGVIKYLGENTGVVKGFATAIASIWVIGKVSAIVSAIDTIIKAYKALRTSAAMTAIVESFATAGMSIAPGVIAATATAAALGITGMAILGLAKPATEGTPRKAIHGSNTADIGHGYHGGRGGRGRRAAGRAVGGSVMGRSSYYVGENGPELFTPSTSGRITPNGLGGSSGMTVVVNVQGSVISERDLAVTVRDNIAIMMRRQGLNPSILGV